MVEIRGLDFRPSAGRARTPCFARHAWARNCGAENASLARFLFRPFEPLTKMHQTKKPPRKAVFRLVEIRGLEPLASALRTRRYTSLAISPYSVRCQWRLKTRSTAKNTIHQRHQKINNFFAIIASVSLDIFGLLRYNNKARKMRPWLSWIERLATDQKVGGSNPSGRATSEQSPLHAKSRFA